jgi:hypothetical protein
LKGEGETDVEEGKEKEVVGRREKELEAEILRMKAEQKSLEEKLTEKCKDLEYTPSPSSSPSFFQLPPPFLPALAFSPYPRSYVQNVQPKN